MKTIVKFELSNLQYPFVSFQIKHFEVSGSICLKKGLLGMEFNKKKNVEFRICTPEYFFGGVSF